MMKEASGGSPSRDAAAKEIVWTLLRDLAELTQAQASLTGHLLQLLERLRRNWDESALEERRPAVDKEVQGRGGSHSPGGTDLKPETTAGARAGRGREAAGSQTGPRDGRVRSLAPAEGVGESSESPRDGSAASEMLERQEAGDSVEEGPDEVEVEEPDAAQATVLILESGNARVGVLWDQVVQIGSLNTPTVPEKIESDRGSVPLVSLGLLLHGVSSDEKYFVVVEQDGERAAIASERIHGVGPLVPADKQGQGERIQVLRVPLLRSFAVTPKSASLGAEAMEKGRHPAQRSEEERDRHGPLRALVAVRYLPARVAICRYLRGRGWQVGEAAGVEAATVSLDLGRWDALFLEARSDGEKELAEKLLLQRVEERGIPIIRVGSRLSGFPEGTGPILMFPFSDADLDTLLVQAASRIDL